MYSAVVFQPYQVPFHQDAITCVDHNSDAFVALKPTCVAMGLRYVNEEKRLQRSNWATISKMETVAADGRRRQMTFISRRTFALWLATIDADQIKDHAIRSKIELYQREAADVLDRHFFARTAPTSASDDRIVAIIEQHNRDIETLRLEVVRLSAQHELAASRLAREVPHGWYRLMKYARGVGITIHPRDQAAEGRRCAEISRGLSVNPLRAAPPGDGHPANYYPKFVLQAWRHVFLTANPQWRSMLLFPLD